MLRYLKKLAFPLSVVLCLSACTHGTQYDQQAAQEAQRFEPPANASEYTHKQPPPPQPRMSKAERASLPVVKVGLLVPFSGKAANLGSAFMDASMQALFDRYNRPGDVRVKVEIIAKDTKGTALGAQAAAQEAIGEGARILLGPLFTDAVKAASRVSKSRGIPMITFSNNRDVASPNVYVFGFVPIQQVARVAEGAMGMKIKDFALLAPNNDYGQRVSAALRRAVVPGNGNVSAVEFYAPEANDVDIEIQRLLKAGKSTFKKIDAIMIAEGGAKLEYIVDRLANFGASRSNVKLLGTGKWDDESLLFNKNVHGGLFASTPMRAYQTFKSRFTQQYGYQPPRIASLGYDATALAIALANAPRGPAFTAANITKAKGYYGAANGLFRCSVQGICDRALSLIEVTSQGFKEIEPAPRAFR